jgi:tripartite ATP-independent transporter DctM subunit
VSLTFLLLIAVFVTGALLRVPIAYAMIAAGMAYLFASGQDVGLAGEQIMNSLFASHVLLAIPMFILAASVMNAGTISERLWGAADALVGRLRGGLAHVSVLVSLVFSSMSGSAVADAAGPGMVAIRMMRQVGGYSPGFAVAITAAGATIAPIIPPSIPLVIYALVSGASVGGLFLGGVVPGLLMGGALMATIALLAKRLNLPEGRAVPAAEASRTLRRALLPVTLPVVLLGGIWSGAFTPTEAGAVAALYAMFLAAFVYRALSPSTLLTVFIESTRASATVMVLIAGAFAVNYAVTTERLDQQLALWIAGMELSPLAFLLVINIVFLILGCLVDTGTLLLVLVPVLLPSVRELGIDLVHFGVVIVVNLMIGLITPPYGMLLFVLSALTDAKLPEVMRAIWPFVAALVVVLFAITFLPGLVLFLPRAFGFA